MTNVQMQAHYASRSRYCIRVFKPRANTGGAGKVSKHGKERGSTTRRMTATEWGKGETLGVVRWVRDMYETVKVEFMKLIFAIRRHCSSLTPSTVASLPTYCAHSTTWPTTRPVRWSPAPWLSARAVFLSPARSRPICFSATTFPVHFWVPVPSSSSAFSPSSSVLLKEDDSMIARCCSSRSRTAIPVSLARVRRSVNGQHILKSLTCD